MDKTKSVLIMAASLAVFAGVGITIMRVTKAKATAEEIKPVKFQSRLTRFIES